MTRSALVALVALAALLAVAIGVTTRAWTAPTPAPPPSTPGPTFVIHAGTWDCTTILLDGAWAWPPICSPKETK